MELFGTTINVRRGFVQARVGQQSATQAYMDEISIDIGLN